MKKTLSTLLIIAMIMSLGISISAEQPVSTVLESTNIVNVTGKLESGGDSVYVLLMSDNDVKYVNAFPVEEDGSYRAKFKYNGDIEGLTLRVRQGEEDATGSVVSAVSEKDAVVYTLDVVNSPVNTEVKSKIENYYNLPGKTYQVIVAYYGENDKLENVIMLNAENIGNDITIFEEDFKIPDYAKKVKVFMWENAKTMIPLAESVEGKKSDVIRLLAIGNSHTADALTYFSEIAKENGDNFVIRHAMKNGGSFFNHWSSYQKGEAPYSEGGEARTLDYFVEDGSRYDYIVVANIINYSDSNENFVRYGDDLVKYIREHQPTAEILIHQTWAYENKSPDVKFNEMYGGDRDAMYKSMKEKNAYACEYFATLTTDEGSPVSLDGKPLRYLPSADAFENASASDIFKTSHSGGSSWNTEHNYLQPDTTDEQGGRYITLYRDSYHASHHHGRYLVALTWYRALTGKSVLENTYTNTRYQINEIARPIINAAAQKAVDDTGIWN